MAKLERMRELLATAQDARRPASYARAFDQWVATDAITQEAMANYERDLLKLDHESWSVLKAAAFKRLIRNRRNGWDPLFGLLNEAKAYAYLMALGCTDIQTIPHSYDTKSPDLRAQLKGRLVLCEVKTINIRDDERTIRVTDGAQSTRSLSQEFLRGKLTRTLHAAKGQLDAFPSAMARKIVYVVFNPDKSLNEYVLDHALQIRDFLNESPIEGVEVSVTQ